VRKGAEIAEEETVRLAAGPEAYHHLGQHCWVLRLADGSVKVGVEDEFAGTVGEIESVDLPGIGDVLEQGSVCARFETADGKSHTIWSPVSGSVLEANHALSDDPGPVTTDPFGEGWLLRLDARNLDEELSSLG
jgi:glycine cleavage system H protein